MRKIDEYVNNMCKLDAIGNNAMKGNNAIKDVIKSFLECEKHNQRKLIKKSREDGKKRTDIFRTTRRDIKHSNQNWLEKFY